MWKRRWKRLKGSLLNTLLGEGYTLEQKDTIKRVVSRMQEMEPDVIQKTLEWHNTEEELPDQGEKVVFVFDADVYTGWYCGDGTFREAERSTQYDAGSVVAWAPWENVFQFEDLKEET